MAERDRRVLWICRLGILAGEGKSDILYLFTLMEKHEVPSTCGNYTLSMSLADFYLDGFETKNVSSEDPIRIRKVDPPSDKY